MIRITHLDHCSLCLGSLFAYVMCGCASPASSPKLHFNGRHGSNRIPGRRCLLEHLAESRGGLDVDGFGEEVVVVVGAGGSQENDRSGVGGG